MRRLLFIVPVALLLAWACGRSEVYRFGGDDLFTDGGHRDGGRPDAGRDPWFECDIELQDCGGDGGACFYYRLGDGGVGSHCTFGQCDLVAQDCPATQKCAFEPRNAPAPARVCVPAGAVQEGQHCVGDALSNDCARGLTCAPRGFEDGGSEFICRRFCFSTETCASPQICYALVALPGTTDIPLTCENPPYGCDLISQNCSRAGEGCYPGEHQPLCFSSGNVQNGAVCTFPNQCQKGSACIGNRCRPLCSFPEGPAGCDPAARCTQLQIPGIDGGVGACL